MKTSIRANLIVLGCVVALLLVSACRVPGMHRPVLQQGNLITQAMVDELKPGMSKEQVEYVLGRPVHINTFNVDRWEYVYTFEDRLGKRTRRHLSVTFEDEELVRLEGDFKFGDEEESDSTEAEEIDDPEGDQGEIGSEEPGSEVQTSPVSQ